MATTFALFAVPPLLGFAQDALNSDGYTKGGLQFKKSNPIPFGKLDRLLGSSFTYKPRGPEAGQMDLGVPVDKEAAVKLLDYSVNDDVVDIAVDVEGIGRGRICIETIFFASSVNEALSFFYSPQTAKYMACQAGALSTSDTKVEPAKSAANDRSKAAIAEKLDKLKATEKSLAAELEKVRASIAELNAKQQSLVGKPKTNWIIKEFGVWEVNTAGGVDPYFVFYNPNDKTPIKYISLRISLFNAVGDMVGSQIGNERTRGIQFTGPLSQEDGEYNAHWDPIWYNPTGSCIKVESMTVTWMNGKSQAFSGRSLTDAMAPDVSNDCRARR